MSIYLPFNDNSHLHVAVMHGNMPLIMKMLSSPCDISVDAEDVCGYTALCYAVIWNRNHIVKVLLEHYIKHNLNVRNIVSKSLLLQRAVQYDNYDVLQMLLLAHADINTQDSNGNTALHYAADKCSDRIISLLIEFGARKDIRNNNACTAYDIACKRYFPCAPRILIPDADTVIHNSNITDEDAISHTI